MAWLTVDDTVDGPKLRRFCKKLGCSKFEGLGILVFLWMWGLNNASPEGLLNSVEKDDIQRYLYGVGGNCSLDLDYVVECLIESGWVDSKDGALYIHDWECWQAYWFKAMKRREADVKRKREGKKVVSDGKLAEDASDLGIEKAETRKSSSYPSSFEEFWSAYPRKADKGNAYKKYQARLKDGYSEAELVMAAKNYASVCKREHTEEKYIKHAKTFLSDSTPFRDYLPKKEESKQIELCGNPFSEYGGD